MKTVEIEKCAYVVNDDEFNRWSIDKFSNVNVLLNLSLYERIVSLINDISKDLGMDNCVIVNPTHGGFVPIACSPNFKNVYTANVSPDNSANIATNIANHCVTNVKPIDDASLLGLNIAPLNALLKVDFMFVEKSRDVSYPLLVKSKPHVLLTETNPTVAHMYHKAYKLTETNLSLYVSQEKYDDFQRKFVYYINNDTGEFFYDNLINLCIMVKNGGQQFEDMLRTNLPLIDEWTILDTGSTDGTLEIINKMLVGQKRGNLFQEPFINFRDSRNRLIELAGKRCKYILMLDDTYRIEGNLRGFLTDMRGDQKSDSLSLYIKSDDVEYSSNRILKTNRNLKYLYRIHEVIQEHDNMNVIIPNYEANILDGRFEYMEERTMARKELDLKLLYDELEEDPDNPRTHYYLAQTYNIIGDYENSYKWYLARMNHNRPGFLQEKIDSIFEAARKANFNLGKPWAECEQLYLRAYELDKSRPDSLYFLGVHYYLEGSRQIAYNYFKKGFELGYPVHCQYSLKPTLSYYFLPKFLTELCYDFGNYELGEKAAKLFLEKNPSTANGYDVQVSWHNIFVNLNKMEMPVNFDVRSDKPLLCFVADGGFEPWTGADILTKGVGGSETYIIEMARYIQQHGHFKVVVFCNCGKQSVFEDVDYIPLDCFQPFAKQINIDTCIISRFTEYVPVAIHGKVDNIYIVLHDLTPSGVVIPMSPKLKNIFCLSEWHVGYFLERFPMFKKITVPFYYGIGSLREPLAGANSGTTSLFPSGGGVEGEGAPVFIYSSFPNRGLLQLLQMWPKIVGKYPTASLHIYSDVNGKWVNSVEPNKMTQIRQLLNYYKDIKTINIVYHGWVSKSVLATAWVKADYWLYPCTFMETFCLTALEAAISKTVCITNGLAALQNTVGDRGICIEGDTTTIEWQERALIELFSIMENRDVREKLVNANYQWASNLTWKNRAYKLVNEYLKTSLCVPLPPGKGPSIEPKSPVVIETSRTPILGKTSPVVDVILNWACYFSPGEDKNKTIIQIGSHVGDTPNDPIFNMIDNTTKLILVEPVPFLFEQLQNNYKRLDNKKIFFINKAVSDFIGETEMTIPSEKNNFEKLPFWASQLASINPNHALGHLSNLLVEKITVKTTTLNEIVSQYNLTQIDLLQVDTEGHDYTILMNYNFDIKPKQIMFEHKHMDGLLTVGIKYTELSKRLTSFGYKKIYEDTEDNIFQLVL